MARYYTLDEAALTLGLTADEVRKMTERNELRAFRDRGTLRLRAEDIEELARSLGRGAAPEPCLGMVESRMSRWNLDSSDFSDGLQRAKELIATDPDMALTKCRQLLEACMYQLHEKVLGDPGTKPLEQLIAD